MAPSVAGVCSSPAAGPRGRTIGCDCGCRRAGIAWRSRSPAPARASQNRPPTTGSAARWRWALRSSLRYLVLAAALVVPSLAHAFADAVQFFDQPTTPHAATFGAFGEGIYFTGARRFASLECSSCHGGGPQRVGLRLNADDPALFANGYQPGKTYELQVLLTNES